MEARRVNQALHLEARAAHPLEERAILLPRAPDPTRVGEDAVLEEVAPRLAGGADVIQLRVLFTKRLDDMPLHQATPQAVAFDFDHPRRANSAHGSFPWVGPTERRGDMLVRG